MKRFRGAARVRKERPGGGKYSRTALRARVVKRRAQNKIAKQARKVNR